MIVHKHPYPPFVPIDTEKLIVGTLPPPRFSVGELYKDDVDFCYGSKYGLLWPILEQVFDTTLSYENTHLAIEQRKQLLVKNRLGICDMVGRCTRERVNASDMGMKDIRLRDLIGVLRSHPSIHTVLFMGGITKNGPEYLFRKHLKASNLALSSIQHKDPRIHELILEERSISCVSLISPSSAANRSIGAHPRYKKSKALNPEYTTLDFRVEQYEKYIR